MRHLRVATAMAFLGTQAALIATAPARPDHAFGFQMFAESSTVDARLWREVVRGDRTVREPIPGGRWTARDARGAVHQLSWYDRVRSRRVARLDGPVFASYGARAQLQRLEAALADVAVHALGDPDAETRTLGLDVTVRRNGHSPERFTFTQRAP